LPAWFRPATAVPFGIVVTAADLPNAFPYFVAIERMVSFDTSIPAGLSVIGLYAVIYCIPCLVLLVVGLAARRRTQARRGRLLSSVRDRSTALGAVDIIGLTETVVTH